FQYAPPANISKSDLAPFVYSSLKSIRLTFINGHFSPDHSDLTNLPKGVSVKNLAEVSNHEVVHNYLGKLAKPKTLAFTALNTAFIDDGAFIHIDRNTVLERPIHLLFYTTEANTPITSHPRSLIVAEKNSQVSLVETFAGSGTYLTNAVTEIVAKDNANINHVRIELESDNGLHVANLQADLNRSSTFTSHVFSIGGAFVRNDISAHLRGEGSEATVNGFYMLEESQHIDNYTLLEHVAPHCPSHELYKGILSGSSRAVFRGKIHVHQEAQNTDAYQQNENILLSDNARINTKPQLEIYADEVKCSHGATVGQLDENALFYLQARGIPKPEARRILLRAFADDVVGRVKLEPVRTHLKNLIDAKLERIYKKETA
ncbi:MAG: Fe-S cluster assembly protein SufD, partial [Candidatus Latescibacteria bacterium]|nr:Fe-S cluster assembly protein SufD [Candidatus Latescibacterota bacterium]